jgi:hypothetical protein
MPVELTFLSTPIDARSTLVRVQGQCAVDFMKAAWVVVANPVRVRLFERHLGEVRLQPLAYFSRPPAEVGSREAGGTALDANAGELVAEVSRFLNHGVDHDQCGGLVMLAPQSMLNELLARLSPASVKSLRFEAPVDFTVLTTSELEERLAHFEATDHG